MADQISNNWPKKAPRINRHLIKKLDIKCEWKGCGNRSLSKFTFYKHIGEHVKDVEVGVDESEEEYYICLWSDCSYTSRDPKEIIRHVKYHGYISGLKALGSYMSKTLALPPCVITSEYHAPNNVGDIPYNCYWSDCSESCSGIQEFIDHVHQHLRDFGANEEVKCLWADCTAKFRKKYRLTEHVKVHTKGHFVACPNCGNTFANKTKFVDHCMTQKPLEEHTFQCNYCLSYHPTERILKKHMGQHIHHYSCPFCKMTCNKPAQLAKHIRNRHLDYKFFKCSSCSHECKSKFNLKIHLMSHVTGPQPCLEPGCDYIASSQSALKGHYDRSHVPGREYGPFVCHVCDKKFTRGQNLTRHLSSKHKIKKPPGYSRFLYKIDTDGCRRLQTIRLESVDASELTDYEEIHNAIYSSKEQDVDDPLMSENLTDVKSVMISSIKEITVDILGEKGQILKSCIVTPDDSLPPPEAQVLAVGS